MTEANVTDFTLLACRIVIEHDDPKLGDTFRYLVDRAQQSFAMRKTLTYRVSGIGPYRIYEEQDHLHTAETRDGVLNIVYGRVHHRVIERLILSGWVALHGALATVGGRRTLILGSKGAGKTTLALRLFYAGHAVEGDEMVFIRDGEAIALPRPFHVKPDTDRQVPEIAGLLADMPSVHNGPTRIVAFDPSDAQFPWRIGRGPIDRVVWLVKNHGGDSAIAKKPSLEAIRHVIEHSFNWGEPRRTLMGQATRLGARGGYELKNGELTESIRLLEL